MLQKRYNSRSQNPYAAGFTDQKLYVRQIGINGIMVGYCVLLKFQFACKSSCETLQIALHIAPKLTILGWKHQNFSGEGAFSGEGVPLFLEIFLGRVSPSPQGEGDTLPLWGGGHPLPTPYLLGACGASILALCVPTLNFFYKLTTDNNML